MAKRKKSKTRQIIRAIRETLSHNWQQRRLTVIAIGSLLLIFVAFIAYRIESNDYHLINQAPYTIHKSGYYRLAHNLHTNKDAIIIDADDVTLDLGGFQISNTFKNRVTARNKGVLFTKHQNITVRNGSINGFFYGVYANNDNQFGGNIVENLKLINNIRSGICAVTKNTIIRDNLISQTYGAGEQYTYGILAQGPGMIIEKNYISGIYPSPGHYEAAAVSLTNSGLGSVIENNTITNSKDLDSGRTIGIWVGAYENSKTSVSIINNNITNMVVGIAASAPAGGLYRDNTVLSSEMNFYTNSTSFKDGGNNFGDGQSDTTLVGLSGEKIPDYK